VSEPRLYRWRDDFLAVDEAALAGGTWNGANPTTCRMSSSREKFEKRNQILGGVTIPSLGSAPEGVRGDSMTPSPKRGKAAKTVCAIPFPAAGCQVNVSYSRLSI
jgi:hypothetical protein